jgi:serine/threonine protein kinase
MGIGETAAGLRKSWSLVKKLGEGDAGEVYRVESLLDRRTAILKRPHRSSFTSDMLRQAGQIQTEARILKALEGLFAATRFSTPLRAPAVIDQSQSGSEFGKDFFIIIEQAPGYDLAALARVARLGSAEEVVPSSPADELFLNHLVKTGCLPELILLRVFSGLIELLEKLHFYEIASEQKRQSGVIWNDVKAGHLFWNPSDGKITIIDWGNGQFLEGDGVTQDRRYSRMDDHVQFLRELGKFLSDANPKLFEQLQWPEDLPPGKAYSEGVKPLKDRLFGLLEQALSGLRDARRKEADLLGVSAPGREHLHALHEVQEQILDYGEIPEIGAIERLYTRYAAQLAGDQNLEELIEAYQVAASLPDAAAGKWLLLKRLAEQARSETELHPYFLRALHAGTVDDWPACMWSLLSAYAYQPLPDWWEDVSQEVRFLHLQADPGMLPPYIVSSRVYFTLQAEVLRRSHHEEAGNSPELVLRSFEEEVVKKWKLLEPDPPHSGIQYSGITSLLDDVEALLPGTGDRLQRALAQPKAQAQIAIDAWRRKEFETARRALRTLLLWDPHRRRLYLADQAIQSAQDWLLRVRQGARRGEPFLDYLAEVELAGRELRNQVGPAPWLDVTLDALKQLRSGAQLADLLLSRPELLAEVPWLNQHQSRETVSLPRRRALTIERDPERLPAGFGLAGAHEGLLGAGGPLALGESLDTWLPEARGSSARVFAGYLNGQSAPVAIKLMRPDQTAYALPLFREEAQVLTILRDVPGVTAFLECGFLRLDKGLSLPGEDRRVSAADLRGEVVRYGADAVQSFLAQLESQTAQGWLPYMAFPIRPHENNLITFCDAGHTRGQFLPLRESLLLAIQICDILQVAHDRSIVYRDHKILHYYWDPNVHGVTSIDWNIARRYPQGVGSAEKEFDLVQFGARALHHILTGRAAPGSLPLGPNRPEEIEAASHRYRVQWTYDDERLPNRIKEILEKSLAEGYSQARDLRSDLYEVFQQLPAQEAGSGG